MRRGNRQWGQIITITSSMLPVSFPNMGFNSRFLQLPCGKEKDLINARPDSMVDAPEGIDLERDHFISHRSLYIFLVCWLVNRFTWWKCPTDCCIRMQPVPLLSSSSSVQVRFVVIQSSTFTSAEAKVTTTKTLKTQNKDTKSGFCVEWEHGSQNVSTGHWIPIKIVSSPRWVVVAVRLPVAKTEKMSSSIAVINELISKRRI